MQPNTLFAANTNQDLPHFWVHGYLLSAWRVFGNKPARLYVEWPPLNAYTEDVEVSTQAQSSLPLLWVSQWFPVRLERAWCIGAWQWLFLTTPLRPDHLEVFVCTYAHPQLRTYLRYLQAQAEATQPWWGAGHVF